MSGKGRKLRPDMSTKVPTWKALGNRGEDLGTFRSPEPDGEPVPAIFGSLHGNSSFLPFSSRLASSLMHLSIPGKSLLYSHAVDHPVEERPFEGRVANPQQEPAFR